ncbi:MAG: hypothetical protein J2P48_17325 [Alphaproteobacteria bacterium]|nr:hypothetical protein [Alphaproteobacteria bacterium]
MIAYVTACSIFEQAGGELDRRLQDPAFADPKSKVAKEGVMYSRLVSRPANLMITLANTLCLPRAGARRWGPSKQQKPSLQRPASERPAGAPQFVSSLPAIRRISSAHNRELVAAGCGGRISGNQCRGHPCKQTLEGGLNAPYVRLRPSLRDFALRTPSPAAWQSPRMRTTPLPGGSPS